MPRDDLTDGELLVLGLVAEMPRHGYQLEQVIEERGMREWSPIGFSSIYFVLGTLVKKGLIRADRGPGGRARKAYRITRVGTTALVRHTLDVLTTVRPVYPSVMLGMLHWPVLTRRQALEALRARRRAVDEELRRLGGVQLAQQPLPDHVDAMFDFSIGQLRAEAAWIAETLAYMETKPWHD